VAKEAGAVQGGESWTLQAAVMLVWNDDGCDGRCCDVYLLSLRRGLLVTRNHQLVEVVVSVAYDVSR
jgi:hypothetical protein